MEDGADPEGKGDDPFFADLDYALHLARARRRMSQREFAALVGLSKSRLARLEQGDGLGAVRELQRVLTAAGFHLAVVDGEADAWDPVYDTWQFRDRGGRRFPAHHVARPRRGMTRWEWIYQPGPDPAFTWGRHEWWG